MTLVAYERLDGGCVLFDAECVQVAEEREVCDRRGAVRRAVVVSFRGGGGVSLATPFPKVLESMTAVLRRKDGA